MFIFEPLSLLVVQFQATQGYLDPVSRKERQRQTHRETDTWWGRKKITKQQIYGCVSWETAFSTAVVKILYEGSLQKKVCFGLTDSEGSIPDLHGSRQAGMAMEQ